MTSPDPVPEPPGPAAAMVTTEGSTLSATEVTAQPTAELAAAPPLPPLAADEQPASAAPAATGTSTQGHHRRWAAVAGPSWVIRSPSGRSRRSRRRRRSPAARGR
ncbi:MAG TPA: hypothetical protein VH021_17900 [Trebonia sp.]|nr:hypothetical protein [Trebonia sp.]